MGWKAANRQDNLTLISGRRVKLQWLLLTLSSMTVLACCDPSRFFLVSAETWPFAQEQVQPASLERDAKHYFLSLFASLILPPPPFKKSSSENDNDSVGDPG
nr:unnamed protein product [Spirometra erinaceieuropaei]